MPAPNHQGRPQHYPVEYLDPNPFQPRLQIDPAELLDLIDSIKRFGFYGHLQARPNPDHPGNRLQVVFGHRRLAAVRAAGLRTIPVEVVARTDQEMADQAFIENRTHKQLKPWEEALFLRAYQKQHGCSMRQLGRNLLVSKGFVQNRLDLLKIPEDSPIRPLIERDELDMSTATTLHGLSLQLPAAEVADLVGQVQAGTLGNSDLVRMKKTASPATTTTLNLASEPPQEDQSAPAAPALSTQPGPVNGDGATRSRSPMGRIAELNPNGDTERMGPASKPRSPLISPCGEDEDALIAEGLLTPDGLDLRLEPDGTRAAYRLLHVLEQALPDAEVHRRQADVDSYSPQARQRMADVIDRYNRLFDGIWTED